ncbi:MAG: 5-carboxymethyl-2-hydroxymuconate isomerase [Planctomyces sp.]|jgi:2-keto-4-pentenoate hydratase/2-oxohepta-3-ene-1,7-dioic acid hydratase in catechol pathway|nr:5-carboxymethyl-2-hydroxymuconate isomerase [Planctomyces sp.]MDP7275328.1 fumarylacetoacetate hydrolase family protein [Planctomycetaceae bacterium]
MRLCRFEQDATTRIGFYTEERIVPLGAAAEILGVEIPDCELLTTFLPGGSGRDAVKALEAALAAADDELCTRLGVATASVQLKVPVANPSKLLLLAGNYSKHIEEGGGQAAERQATFPYVFMKPPLTTLNDPGNPIRIPAISPDHIDWELELGIIIGRECRGVSEAEALDHVAGYTVVNDISDRQFKPNPGRSERPKDGFFDWLHGKWHDSFCPMGPCVLAADECDDPQALDLELTVNGEVEQEGSTSEMVFPVTAIIEFISSFVTLVPGDIISTGTTSGVGSAKNKFLRPGDSVVASISGIGSLTNPVA